MSVARSLAGLRLLEEALLLQQFEVREREKNTLVLTRLAPLLVRGSPSSG